MAAGPRRRGRFRLSPAEDGGGKTAEQVELERLRRQNEQLRAELSRTESALAELGPLLSIKQACELVGKPRATHYGPVRWFV